MNDVEEKLVTVQKKIEMLEREYGVSILARGGAYGSARLVIHDNRTGEEMERQ